jgi:hypothetical protein
VSFAVQPAAALLLIALVVLVLVRIATAGDRKALRLVHLLRDGTPAHTSGPRDGADHLGRPE